MTPQAGSIAIIMGSTRPHRACPQISQFVVDTIRLQQTGPATATLTIIDLQDWKLPLYDEPGIPSQIFDPELYKYEHTRAWSREISKYDSFIFVTPQYNWGYPAVLKNAIDYLFHEWKGKGAMVVSYGGHGGDRCNAQLKEVLHGLRMRVVPEGVELTFPERETIAKAATGQSLELDASSDTGLWSAERSKILAAYNELVSVDT